MHPARKFALGPTWPVVIAELGLDAAELLAAAGLPTDLFANPDARIEPEAYFRLWSLIEQRMDDAAAPVRIVGDLDIGAFQPAVFAAFCSPDLVTALTRLSRFKPLMGPCGLDLERGAGRFRVTFRLIDPPVEPPAITALTELLFLVRLARLGTRRDVRPLAVEMPHDLAGVPEIEAFFGITPTQGAAPSVTFSDADATAPFLNANEELWQFFEPELQRRLTDLGVEAEIERRVRAVLLELLPGGESSIDAAAARLGLSRRTLQRRLTASGTSYQRILGAVREQLARHYLVNSAVSHTEIAFLLGFEDPNSFFRAFHDWTGRTPEAVRGEAVH